jgi:sterol desaturase/sphingolipid hydroxylase (fatty acid hydroxylase superfamily)
MSLPFLVRGMTYFGMFFAMLFFEWLVPFAQTEQKKGFRILFHLGISVANGIVLYLIVTRPILAAVAYTQSHGVGITHLLGLTGWAEMVATVVAFDFWDYWMHRANHSIPPLWRFHRAHHSDMEIDVTNAARFHIGELFISNCSKCLMILVWGPSLAGLVAFDVLLNVCSQFHHSNINLPLRIQDALEKVVVTPRMHRCHHALHADCFNTNFATFFSWWDRLFGSYHWARALSELRLIGLFKPRGEVTMKLKSFLLTPIRAE